MIEQRRDLRERERERERLRLDSLISIDFDLENLVLMHMIFEDFG
ncbi:unnamed protein product [Camellia sinensis]